MNAHLITSVWAAVPTTWHVWHYRRLLLPYLPGRPPRGLAKRFWTGVLIVMLPAGFVVAAPRALAPLTQSGAGGTWSPVLPGVFLDRMEATPDGRFFVAGGQGLHVGRAGQNKWQRVDLPADLVLGLTLPAGAIAAYVGTAHGLYASPRVDGRYRRLPFPSYEVHAIAVDPGDSRTLWASSRQGFWRSRDGGDHWTLEMIGLQAPGTAWAITYFGDTLFASDGFGVYRWSGSRWDLSSHQGRVVSLDPTADGRRLFASSMGEGLQVFDGRTWQNSDDGLAHNHGGVRAVHLASVTDRAGGLAFAATMLDGVSISKDGGRSWASLRAGLPPGGVWRVQADGSTLLAATNRGLYQYRLPVTPTPEAGWWVVLFTSALFMGGAAVALAALPQRRGTSGAAT